MNFLLDTSVWLDFLINPLHHTIAVNRLHLNSTNTFVAVVTKGELISLAKKRGYPIRKINFLYAHSLPTPKPTLNDLINLGIIKDIMNMPRGFINITTEQFNSLVKFAYKITDKKS